MSDSVSKSWFAVFNNPEEHGYTGSPVEICQRLRDEWLEDAPTRSGAWAYCVSADGLRHVHMILEDTRAMRFSAIKKSYACGMHFNATKGTKDEAEAYIKKVGVYAEKGESVIHTEFYGEIRGNQGRRNDLFQIEEMLLNGASPDDIMSSCFAYRKYDKMIRQAYFSMKVKALPLQRDVRVFWHCGDSGSGKTYTYIKLCEEFGIDEVYKLNIYDKGGFDDYNGQSVLCLDEFRGQFPFALFLQYLDGYRVQIPCRYVNSYACWNEVHIFTIFSPELVYSAMVQSHQELDVFYQLKRRLTSVIFHYRDLSNGEYKQFELSGVDYINYADLKKKCFGEFEQVSFSFDDVG